MQSASKSRCDMEQKQKINSDKDCCALYGVKFQFISCMRLFNFLAVFNGPRKLFPGFSTASSESVAIFMEE